MNKRTDTTKLNNGVEMPLQGFGVFRITDPALCEKSVTAALETGYRMFDTAACYGNEKAVGEAIRRSGVSRQDIFITSKVWIQDAGYEQTMRSFEKTLKNLQTDRLDLYLIHMPYGDYHGSWRAMEELYRQGAAKAIGVSNFRAGRLADLILSHEVIPAVNQMETHPFCQQRELRRFMNRYDIRLMAWAPFAEGENGIFENPALVRIGRNHGKSAAQVILRWLKQNDIIAIPKSIRPERMAENFNIDDFALSAAETETIDRLDTGKSLILEIDDPTEVFRLHDIRFEQ